MTSPLVRSSAALCAATNVVVGLAVGWSRGTIALAAGLPPPMALYSDLLAVMLIATGAGFAWAALAPVPQRSYLWLFGAGVKLVAAALMMSAWVSGVGSSLLGFSAVVDGALSVFVAFALMSDRRVRLPATPPGV